MTTIIIERELLEQAKNLLSRFMPDNFRDQNCQIEMLTRMDAALAAQPSGAEKCGHCGRRVIDPPWPIAPAAQPSGPAWHDVPKCPVCGAKEEAVFHPRTFYTCGSSDYDQRPGTFTQGSDCLCQIPDTENTK